MTDKRTAGYIRLSRDDGTSLSIENQKAALIKHDPSIKLFVDRGVSGQTNLTDEKSAWVSQLMPFFLEDPSNTEVVVYTYDRIGRKKGKVLSVVEDILDAGGQIHVVREKKTFTDGDDFSQAIDITFRSLSDDQYRVEVQKKTKRALGVLAAAGVTLGRKPTLTEKQIVQIKDLHARGLGYASIGKVVRTKRVNDGKEVNTTPRVVKSVVTGSYMSREEWERRNQNARNNMLNKDRS
jgi:DNA invertase Pin-like site-specific DNA recombinase